MTQVAPRTRCLLWIDLVGGYLVCFSDEVVVGQAVIGTTVHIPVLGDLSRRHAVIRRDGESYLVRPLGPVLLDGRPIERPTLLADGDQLQLGSSVRVRFRQPHALSTSARLDLISPHGTQPSTDGIILMADSCILGPSHHSHVVCRDWSSDVVVFRTKAGHLQCRVRESFEVDGKIYPGQAPLNENSRIVGSDFALSLEAL